MLKKIIIAIFISVFAIPTASFAADTDLNYTTLTTVDLNTFNEYRYKLTEGFFELKSKFEISGSIDKQVAANILDIATKGYNYLPDNLVNKNLYNNLKTALERGIRYPDNSSNFLEIKTEILNYIEKVDIKKVSGSIEAYPSTGNAPLSVTFRAKITDPSGTKIPNYNYVWWMDVGGKRKIISQTSGPSLNYTFNDEGNFSIFLDVKSEHKNAKGYTDVLPFRSREDIQINEKIASIILKVNSLTLREKDKLKFTPEEARFGLVFDATSSTPTGGSNFTQVEWDFGNGLKRKYSGNPQIERVIYSKEGEYTVKMKLTTNEGKVVEKQFIVVVHDPIATIKTNISEGYLGDKFTFSSESGLKDENLTFEWEIIDISKDKIIFTKTGKLFTYSFAEKGQYNVRLKVTEPSSNVPDIDTKIIYINSKAPVVSFVGSIPFLNKPNMVLLDATKTYDPDFSDEGKLKFSWIIDGERVELENPNYNGSVGYYTFDSAGEHSVVLEVTDPDQITIQFKDKVSIKSTLSVDFGIYPRVATRDQTVRFIADSPEARVYEWDFGDGDKVGGAYSTIDHKYKKSGVYKVKLKVIDKDDKINSFIKEVYVGQSDYPLAFIRLNTSPNNNEILYKEGECNGKGAYILDRVNSIKFSGEESINIDGQNKNLTYSWKLDNNKYYSSKIFDKKYDELGCFPVTLTVKSEDNGRSDSKTIWVKVENLKPVLSSIDFKLVDENTDPVVVNVSALGAKDIDGVIQNYLWYYYTDIDPEPQDFRSTRNPNTTFVLPKVTGSYYFVVVMKDNNDARINSEEINSSKYFVTLAGDNLNTPIIKLNADNTSVSIGDEITFSTQVENILGYDISKNVEYSWDFDGDGFYEKETNAAKISHIFENSGEFHTKVKAKHKGFSNTKSITISVANILKPDFSYISIGNKFIFLDNSKGSYSNIEWDLGDSTVVKDKKAFIHEYSDDKVSHEVTLKLKEGTKTKSSTLKVVKNVKNFLKSKQDGLVYFSNFDIVDDKLILEDLQNVYVYLKESKGNIKYYGVDFDINYDSDLNGGKDDDINNSNQANFTSGDPILIELNKQREQKVRLFLLDENKEVIDSYDFIIIKNYIEELSIDINAIDFTGVSDSEKLKIEKLKNLISNIDKEYKLKSLMYVQKLQEEWFDDREKTNVILEFENYIIETGVKDGDEIINTLESLLVEGQEDKSEKSITFNALKNLIPSSIACDTGNIKDKSCYDILIEKLELIKNNSNIEENKIIGVEILKVIEVDTVMTNKQKVDFKAILKTFVYGGLENIPQEDLPQEDDDKEKKSASSNLIGLLIIVFKGVAWIIGIIGIFIILFYLWYKLTNNDPNIGFQDFIIEKTSGHKKTEKQEIKKEDDFDILSDIKELDKKSEEISKKEKKVDFDFDIEQKQEEIKEEKTDKEVNLNMPETKNVPDWLKGSFEETPKQEEKKQEIPEMKEEIKEEQKIDDKKIPDWLKGSFEETSKPSKLAGEEKAKEEKKKKDILDESLPTNEELEDITKIKDEEISIDDKKIPDWLKGSFEEVPKQKDENIVSSEEKPVLKENKEEDKKESKSKATAKEEKTESLKSDKKEEKQDKKDDKTTEKKDTSKTKKPDSDLLWDDGMKVPDWLKTDGDK